MSQFALKFIAMVAMLLDHTAKVVLSHGVLAPILGMELNNLICTSMVVIGRISFPMFAWFTAEGCRKSSRPGKYLGRLAIFAVLSEIPFQLCFLNRIEFGCNNVIFTLLLAAAGIYAAQQVHLKLIPDSMIKICIAVVVILLGWFLHTDYNAWGVALVIALYYMPTEKGKLLLLSAWITVFQLIWHGWNGQTLNWLSGEGSIQLLYWIGAMFSVAFLATYNGEKGRGNKWLFYVFYPSHLILLYVVSLMV